MRRAVSTGALLGAISFAQTSFGADVGLVATNPKDPFATELAAELEQLGFTVSREENLVATSRESAIVLIQDTLELYEVLEGGTLRKRQMTATKRDAVKAAEEVRAFLLPLETKPSVGAETSALPLEQVANADHSVEPVPPPGPKTVEFTLGAGALWGGATPGMIVSASTAMFPRPLRSRGASIGVGAGAIADLLPENVSGAQGSADVRAILFGPEIIGRLEVSPRLELDLAVGVWANHLRVAGNANAPFTSHDESAWTWSPTARLRPTYRIGPLAIFAEGRLGMSMPAVAIRFDGGTVREWGRPWGALGAGLAVMF